MIIALYTLLFSLFFKNDPVNTGHPQARLEVRFSNFIGNKQISPDSSYTNSFGENYTVQRLKYYITNIELLNTKNNKRVAIEESYFLVDDNDEVSKAISLPVSEGSYDGISFLLGVDSLHNVSGAQTGALDPLNGMFWTWNSGYVSIKIEGKSTASNLPQNLIEYHLGGFKGPDKVNQRINLSFPGNSIDLSNKKATIIYVRTDLNLFFNSVHSLPIKTNPACTAPGILARQYSENYATIFSIDKIENK
jgi:hypothetical protein